MAQDRRRKPETSVLNSGEAARGNYNGRLLLLFRPISAIPEFCTPATSRGGCLPRKSTMAMNLDAAMLEMFRSEVETHMAALSEGLLALEKQPRRSELFEPMMRAAHSIKGAAKIVGLPAAVQVAHAIEDCFVAVRENRVAMSSGLVDVLLAGVDLLGRAADVDDAGQVSLAEGDPQILQAVSRIATAMRENAAGAQDNQIQQLTLRAPAQLTGSWAASQRDRIVAALAAGGTPAQFDLSDVETIDAAAIGFLALASGSTQARESTKFTTFGARRELAQLLRAAGLSLAPHSAPGGA